MGRIRYDTRNDAESKPLGLRDVGSRALDADRPAENDDLGPSPLKVIHREIIEALVRVIEDCVGDMLGICCWTT